MPSRLRSAFLAAGAAALLSTQAAYAAPALSSPSLDPLVSLSVMGSAQSRAAVCAGSTAATAAAAAAAQAAPGSCVLPVTAPPPPPPVVGEAVPPPVVPPPKAFNPLWLLAGLAAVGLIAWLILKGDNGNGDVTPVSPA